MPDDFLRVAEETGLMLPIGRWVLAQACRQARSWRDAGFPVTVSVNLSPAQFTDAHLLSDVDAALAGAGLAPALLDLEITEAAIMKGAEQSGAIVHALRERGIGLTIDNFGTGYSRLGALRQVPLSRLKIDRSFVQDIVERPDDAAIIGALIAVGRSLNLRVIAEGVETAAQLAFLQQHGCDQYQGHYASEAQADPDFTRRCS